MTNWLTAGRSRGEHGASKAGPKSQPGTTTALMLTGLSKSFRDVHAVRGIDLVIEARQTVALLGPNGAGKSTTMDMILGLTTPDSGTVRVLGAPPQDAVRRGVVAGMVQTGALPEHLKVRELVTMVASFYPAPLAVDQALELLGIADLADRPTRKLSGGQAQRTRAALALVANANLLVLDEPTAALDVEARRHFWQAIRSQAAGAKTVIFATHYLEEADMFADRVVVIAGGRIVADGTPSEVKSRVAGRTVRATAPGADLDALSQIPGVTGVEREGGSVIITCTDSDAVVCELQAGPYGASDLEVTRPRLDDVFLALTSGTVAPGSHEEAPS
jgi:ABC-2 type transport system ATP-binding protein